MAKILSLLILVAMFVLLIPTGLVLASQNAVPGDATYPVKRKLEDIIVAVASIHPATLAYFQVDFSKRRFTESAALFARGDSKEASEILVELAVQNNLAVSNVVALHSDEQKEQLIDEMLTNISDYKQHLSEIKSQSESLQVQPKLPLISPTPTPTSVQLRSTPTPTKTPPTPTPSVVQPTTSADRPVPSATPIPPDTPTPVPVRQSVVAPPVTTTNVARIVETIKKLEEDEKRLNEEKRKHPRREKDEDKKGNSSRERD